MAAPCLVAEVLSPSSEVVDRRDKRLADRPLEGLRWYLPVSQDRRLVEVYRRDAEGGWRHDVLEDGTLALACGGLDIRITRAELGEDMNLG